MSTDESTADPGGAAALAVVLLVVTAGASTAFTGRADGRTSVPPGATGTAQLSQPTSASLATSHSLPTVRERLGVGNLPGPVPTLAAIPDGDDGDGGHGEGTGVNDSDEDGLRDEREHRIGTDPTDTDGDRFDDFEEIRRGTDPLDPASPERTTTTERDAGDERGASIEFRDCISVEVRGNFAYVAVVHSQYDLDREVHRDVFTGDDIDLPMLAFDTEIAPSDGEPGFIERVEIYRTEAQLEREDPARVEEHPTTSGVGRPRPLKPRLQPRRPDGRLDSKALSARRDNSAVLWPKTRRAQPEAPVASARDTAASPANASPTSRATRTPTTPVPSAVPTTWTVRVPVSGSAAAVATSTRAAVTAPRRPRAGRSRVPSVPRSAKTKNELQVLAV
jgi:hypothetical protein